MGVGSVPTQTEMAAERTGDTVTEQDAQSEMADAAEREEQRRDLLHQVGGIEQDESEILFQDTSPRRPMAIIYATLDGEPLVVTRKRARKLLERTLPDGRFMFVADIKKAPAYQKGALKCFLHKDSPERELMDSLGLQGKVCPAGQLANGYAKYMHETVKHVKTWEIHQRHVSDKREEEYIERQNRQFDATMASNAAMLELARSNQGGTAAEPTPEAACGHDGCGYTGTAQQVIGHKAGAGHK